MKRALALILTGILSLGAVKLTMAENDILAFDGAEGGGRFASGGRGCEVYIVDTLEDYADDEEPIKGSLRDAVSQDNRTIVFNVSGVINLKDKLIITNRKNLTIAGQTAPGDGITIYGFETNLSNSENIIMRYIRFRPGAKNVHKGDSMDAIWGRSMKNIMIDHISASWSTDEAMSLYRAENMTVQWSVIEESLAMSGHTKGRHGYGGIWGGVNTTFHHNLIANHTSRNPRFGGGTVEADDNEHIAKFDVRNNVIYNWGFNTAYGGGRAEINYVNNYVKAGPGTRDKVKDRLIDCGEKEKPSKFYISGNYMEGNEEISRDNSRGIYISEENKPFTEIVDKEFEMDGTEDGALRTQKSQDAYEEVLSKAGAVYPRRDALDARIINEVKNGTGRFANKDSEVGGLPYREETKRNSDFDKDKDGIADEWEIKNGLNPKDSSDSIELAKDGSGYTNIENYFNSLVDMDYVPENPKITLKNPSDNQIFKKGEEIVISAEVTDNDGIEKVEFFNGEEKIYETDKAPYEAKLTLDDGSYFISAKVTDKMGNQTQSEINRVHVNTDTEMGEWKSCDIGDVGVNGAAEVFDDKIIVKGNGKLKDNNDSCHFVYKPFILRQVGQNVSVTAKIDSIAAVDNHAFAGIMIREDLSSDAKTVALGISHTKAYEWKEEDPITKKKQSYYRNPFSIYMCERKEEGGNISELGENLDSAESAKNSGVYLQNDIAFKDKDEFKGYYIKLTKLYDTFSAYTSDDGKSWTLIGSTEVEMAQKVYIGFAADSNKVDNEIENYNTAVFSDIEILENKC